MRTLGLIGGMSWQSTALHYQIINREIGTRLGGPRSAALQVASLDFEVVAALQRAARRASCSVAPSCRCCCRPGIAA